MLMYKEVNGKMTKQDIISNVVDEMQRAIERIKELGEFDDVAITDDEELINDMQISIEKLYNEF